MSEAQRRRILLVCDHAPTLAKLQEVLASRTFDVMASTSSIAAVKDLRKIEPDVVICRDRMPLLSGRRVIKAVEAIDPDIPVILFTDDDDLAVVIETMRAGALDCVLSPVRQPSALVDAAERGLEQVAMLRRARQNAEELKAAQERLRRMLEQSAVIRERAFQRVAEPLDNAARELVALQQLSIGREAMDHAKAALHFIYEVTDRLESATDDASRTSSRTVSLLDFHPLHTAEFLRDAVIRPAHDSGVELAWYVPVDIPTLRGDPSQLQSCLVGLAHFLIDNGSGGLLSLEVQVNNRGSRAWLVQFDLTRGEGESVPAGDDVVERYLPGDDIENVREELIDLSGAARVVRMLGGDLEMYEGEGGAIRFSFDLALIPAKEPIPEMVDPGLASGSVLVVDPIALQRRGLTNELQRLGLDVTSVTTTEAGITAINQAVLDGEPYRVAFVSLALSDVHLFDEAVDALEFDDQPERVFLARAGQVAPADQGAALLLMRPPTRKVLIDLLERYVGLRED